VPDRAVINRMGFNNEGSLAAARRLRDRGAATIVGVNIGKTKVVPESSAAADYVTSTERLAPHADYLVVNVSSPNTPGLRDLQAVEHLRPLLTAVRAAADRSSPRRVPLLVKLAPDLADDDVDAAAGLALDLGLDGIIATNTTVPRDALRSPPELVKETGGLSGAPLKERSLEVLRRLRARTGGRLTLISVGGVESADDVWERIRAGATLVQAYTGMLYGGPLWAWRVNRALSRRLRASAFSTLDGARRGPRRRRAVLPVGCRGGGNPPRGPGHGAGMSGEPIPREAPLPSRGSLLVRITAATALALPAVVTLAGGLHP